jgi:transcription initiation factor TFIID subunit 8
MPDLTNNRADAKIEQSGIIDLDGVCITTKATESVLSRHELNDNFRRQARRHIPQGFPPFPGLHTYQYTPWVEDTVQDTITPGRIREAAVRSAKQSEDALRKLVRAAKLRNQKEARSVAHKDQTGRERYRLWDGAIAGLSVPTDDTSVDSVEQGIILNSESTYCRKEVAKGSKRSYGGCLF